MVSKSAKLLSEGHHELWVAVDLVNQLSQHGDEFLNAALRAKQVGDLTESLDRVHLGVWVLAAKVVDQ